MASTAVHVSTPHSCRAKSKNNQTNRRSMYVEGTLTTPNKMLVNEASGFGPLTRSQSAINLTPGSIDDLSQMFFEKIKTLPKEERKRKIEEAARGLNKVNT